MKNGLQLAESGSQCSTPNGFYDDWSKQQLIHQVEVLQARVSISDNLSSEAIAEAYKYRRLWQCASSCIIANKLKPRGDDEETMIKAAISQDLGPFWAGSTSGWL